MFVKRYSLFALIMMSGLAVLFANLPPVVSNVVAAQRTDGSKIVDIWYDVMDGEGDSLSVCLHLSVDGGLTYTINPNPLYLSGDVGTGIVPGTGKCISWQAGSEAVVYDASGFAFRVTALDGYSLPGGFIRVPAGTFTMGRTSGTGASDELPTHNVTLNSFYICKYEVSQAEYEAVTGSNPSVNYGVGADYPVYYVSWYAALKYCNLRSMSEGLNPVYSISGSTNPTNWGSVPTSNNSTWNAATCNMSANGYRLPTEAEWEYAARGASNSPDYLYSGSNEINSVAWYFDNATSTKQVGTKQANGLGIFDMSGNVYEWCWDWKSGTYYSESPSNNPSGPSTGTSRVKRGGGWYNSAGSCLVADRDESLPHSVSYYIGFRVCRSSQ